MAKVNISLPDGLLEEIDALATEEHTTRSGFLQEAAARYVATIEESRACKERRKRIEAAMKRGKELGCGIDPEFDATARIRSDRDGGWGDRADQ